MTTVAEEYKTVQFLKKKRIKVMPIVKKSKWVTLLETERDDAYMYSKVKRSYTLPANLSRGGQLEPILDNVTLVKTPQYKEPLTELQFFEKQLGGRDLGFNRKEDNFWKTDSLARVLITKDGLTLNMEDAVDVIKNKILLANKDTIAPNWESRNKKPSYQFVLIDEEEEATVKQEVREIEDEAYELYMGIKTSEKKLKRFLKVTGNSVARDTTKGFLTDQVSEYRKKNPKEFISILKDPNFELKAIVFDAIKCGALKMEGKSTYKLPNGVVLGETLDRLMSYLLDPKNIEIKTRIVHQVENSDV